MQTPCFTEGTWAYVALVCAGVLEAARVGGGVHPGSDGVSPLLRSAGSWRPVALPVCSWGPLPLPPAPGDDPGEEPGGLPVGSGNPPLQALPGHVRLLPGRGRLLGVHPLQEHVMPVPLPPHPSPTRPWPDAHRPFSLSPPRQVQRLQDPLAHGGPGVYQECLAPLPQREHLRRGGGGAQPGHAQSSADPKLGKSTAPDMLHPRSQQPIRVTCLSPSTVRPSRWSCPPPGLSIPLRPPTMPDWNPRLIHLSDHPPAPHHLLATPSAVLAPALTSPLIASWPHPQWCRPVPNLPPIASWPHPDP